MNNIIVLYHRADLDGVLSGVIAKHYLSLNPLNNVCMFGADYGDNLKELNLNQYDKIYVLDFSDNWLLTHPILSKKVIWIDHHISAIDKKYKVNQYCINGVAACRLVYQYFTNDTASFLTDQSFYMRQVNEPYIVALTGEYDIWDQTSPIALFVNKAINDLSFNNIEFIYNQLRFIQCPRGFESKSLDKEYIANNKKNEKDGFDLLFHYVNKGEGAIDFIRSTSQTLGGGVKINLLGKIGRAFNTHIRSSLIHKQSKDEDFTMVWCYNGNSMIKVSLYSETIDVSAIASQFGGGGHRGAAGFSVMPHILTKILTVGYP